MIPSRIGTKGITVPLENQQNYWVLTLILVGMVFPAYGHWLGTDMSLDLVVTGSQFTNDNPGNFSVSWSAETNL
jgi:hypothetical protein